MTLSLRAMLFLSVLAFASRAESLPIPHSKSPNGEYYLTLESSSPTKPACRIKVRRSSDPEKVVGVAVLILADDPSTVIALSSLNVMWNEASDIFILGAEVEGKSKGQITVFRTDGLFPSSPLGPRFEEGGRLVSYRFAGDREIESVQDLSSGKRVQSTETVNADGTVSGSGVFIVD